MSNSFHIFGNSEKDKAKASRRAALLSHCKDLKNLYPELWDLIAPREMEISNAKKTTEIEALEKSKTNFEQKLKNTHEENLKAKFSKEQAAKISEEQTKTDTLKSQLLQQCTKPNLINAVGGGMFQKLPDNLHEEKLNSNFSQQDTRIPMALASTVSELKIQVYRYEEKRREITETINHISSTNEEKSINEKLQTFKTFEEKQIAEIKRIDKNYITKKTLLDKLKELEAPVVGTLFSPITDEKKSQHDDFYCDIDGNYINLSYLPENSTTIQINDHTAITNNGPKASDEFRNLYDTFKNNRHHLYQQIAFIEITEENPQDAEINELSTNIANHGGLAKKIAGYNQKHADVISYKNEAMRVHKLDSNSTADLEYWNNENKRCFHGYGGVEIIHNHVRYRVPTRVHQMMMILKRDHTHIEAIISELETARHRRPSFWSNPLSILTRSDATQALYSTPNLFPKP